MGHATVRRIGAGKAIVLADNNDATLKNATECLGAEGHFVVPRKVDVTSTPSVHKLATSAAKLGVVTRVAHTAGLSRSQAETAAIFLAVDLLGAALVLDEFGTVIAPGGAGIVVASMTAHLFPPPSADQQDALAHTPASELLPLPFLNTDDVNDPARRTESPNRPTTFASRPPLLDGASALRASTRSAPESFRPRWVNTN